MRNLKGLYAISDVNLTPNNKILRYLNAAIKGGISIFQYRNKIDKDREIKSLVQDLAQICAENNILFVLNDRFELAISLQVAGLHLGKDEFSHFPKIRKSFKGIIGVSCYDNVEMARDFESKGADYVAFGAMFASNTKPDAKHCDIAILQKAKNSLKLPICAIGGINVNNVNLLRNADMIAVISSLWESKEQDSNLGQNSLLNITKNAREILESFYGNKNL